MMLIWSTKLVVVAVLYSRLTSFETAEAIVVEDKEEKADLDLHNVKLVVKAEKKN